MLISKAANLYQSYRADQSRQTNVPTSMHAPKPSRYFPPPAFERRTNRTPSPTPSEQRALDDDGKANPLKLLKRENWGKLAVLLVIITIFVLLNVFQTPIVHALEPAAKWLYKTRGGWLMPIAILMLLSIPPLFGQEVVLMMIGLAWGPGIGMAIAAAGTLIGELGTFYLFRSVLRQRAAQYEVKNIEYAVLARVIRDGGIKVATVARWSIIPNHMLTALFATCGFSLTTFLVSAVLSLPNQFVNVYFGYALALRADGQSSKTSSIVNNVDIALSIIVTVYAGRYMRRLQNEVKPLVIRERQKRRQADPFALEAGHAVLALAPNARGSLTSSAESFHVQKHARTYTPPDLSLARFDGPYHSTR